MKDNDSVGSSRPSIDGARAQGVIVHLLEVAVWCAVTEHFLEFAVWRAVTEHFRELAA